MAEQSVRMEKSEGAPHRRQISAFIALLLSFLLFLSLISYSSSDQASGEISFSDLWKVFSNDETIHIKAAHTQNWLGLLGAIISNWLINSTIGYAVLIFPVLCFIWSLYLFNRNNLHKKITFTNYAIILAILFASLAGSFRKLDDGLPMEWSGIVGHFLAEVMSTTIGLFGTIVVLLGTIFIVITLLIDLDYRVTLDRLNEYSALLRRWWIDYSARMRERRGAREQEVEKTAVQEHAIKIRRLEKEIPAEEHVPLPVLKKEKKKNEPFGEEKPKSPVPREEKHTLGESELAMEINEPIAEDEVNFDERETSQDNQLDEEIDYVFPSVELLDSHRGGEEVNEEELKLNAELLRAKLADFSVEIENISVTPGPVVTLYELIPAAGVKISRIENLQDDIALALKAKGIRIIAPMPGKGTVGVEIPNHNPSLVTIRSVINSSKFRDAKAALPLALGKTISGDVYVDDLAKMPHLLIAGATGSGKSVGINTIITSILYRLHPSDVKFVIIDPKKIELTLYRKLRKHYLAVSPDIDEEIATEPNNAVLLLKSVEREMEGRYDRLASAGVRNIADYNERLQAGRLHDTEEVKHKKMPYLIVIVDELADLMITAAREVEEPIARLAQLARAVGIHLVLATQRPSVDVITGVIKANFPARLAYQVSSKIDSRTILDMNGADQLLGNGDMLYLPSGSPKPHRIQNAFISTDEVERITNHIGKQKGYSNPFKLPSALEKKKGNGSLVNGDRDELFEEAARVIVRHQQGSVSLLQRRLKVGYSRAARLVDELEAAGIVGSFDGSKAREVLIESEAQLEAVLKSLS
jgi:S-DNA-T family DNA segregation ATPase FtsK/SpoIIIE